ncbi:MAG TPA: DUF5753 domain-containing protein [Streptosporangiaceae bacterium]
MMMSNDERARIVGGFVDELNQAWRRAAAGSYRRVHRLSERLYERQPSNSPMQVLTPSTISRNLAGQRRGLPSWPWVFSLVIVLRTAAANNGVPRDAVGTVEEWKARYEAAEGALYELGRRGRPGHEPGTAASARADMDLLAAADGIDALTWWHACRHVVPEWFRTYLSLEPAASHVRTYETQYIPGLLQTEAYARASMRPDDGCLWKLSDEDLELRVELRMRRQRILERPDGPTLWAIIDETALRRRMGDAATMRGQLRHLIEMSEHDNVAAVQVVPFTSSGGGHAAAGGPITLLRFRERQLNDMIYLEHPTDAIYLDDPANVGHYALVLGRLAVEAHRPSASIDFLHKILADT